LVGTLIVSSLKCDPSKTDSIKFCQSIEEIGIALFQLLLSPIVQFDLAGDYLELCDNILLVLNSLIISENKLNGSVNTVINSASRFSFILIPLSMHGHTHTHTLIHWFIDSFIDWLIHSLTHTHFILKIIHIGKQQGQWLQEFDMILHWWLHLLLSDGDCK
jgi:hypothetical protein